MTEVESEVGVSTGTLSGSVAGAMATASVRIEPLQAGRFRASFEDDSILTLSLLHRETSGSGALRLMIEVDGVTWSVLLRTAENEAVVLDCAGVHRVLAPGVPALALAAQAAPSSSLILGPLVAPMPALVTEVLVASGSLVESGQPLLRIEAMKMVMTLTAPARCRAKTLYVKPQETVSAGQVLIDFDDPE